MTKRGRPVNPDKIKQIIAYFENGANGGVNYKDSTIAQKVYCTPKTVTRLRNEWLEKKIETATKAEAEATIMGRQVSLEEETGDLANRILNKEIKRIRRKQENLEELTVREIEIIDKVTNNVANRVRKKKEEQDSNIEYNIIKMEILGNEEILKKYNIKPS